MKKRHIFRKLFLVGLFLITLAIGGSYLYVKMSPKLRINTANNLMLYDNKGEVFFQGSQSKEWVHLNDISDNVIKATINAEDKNFYKHHGFDFFRILKAGFINLKSGGNVQGASTITQQYAKNLFLTFDKTWKRKWDEMLYTMRIEANYSKDEILEGYLNTINYGHGKYGIENAAKFYFNKNAKDLDLAEASMLVGIPKAPSRFSPFNDLQAAKERQLIILNLMVKNEVISESERDKAYNENLVYVGKDNDEEVSSIMYYQDAVTEELENLKDIPDSFNDSNGLKIYTNLNISMQKKLENTINEVIPADVNIETSVVMMNPSTGGIVALVGGKDYDKSSYNRAISSKRQVGSTMKPYLYYAALENGFTTSSAFTSEATTFTFENQEDYSPKNYNDKYGNKPISMGTAIAYSENIYAVKTHLFLGGDALINVARRVGITSKLEDVPSLPLGTNEISIIEMAAGYAAFANEGYKIEPHFIEKIEDGDGNLLYQAKNTKELVLNSSLTFILDNLLTATYDPDYIDYNYPTAISLSSKLKHKYALKSGTTSSDNWNIGFNKDIVCAVWAGYDDNQPLTTSDYKYAQNIWYNSVEFYEEGKTDDETWYQKPKNVTAMFVEPISGRPANETDEKKKLMYFIKGTEPTSTDQTFDEIASRENAS